MKYGLIVHFKTHNIGDDVQSYAMEKFLPHLDYLIDREHIDSFYTPTGEKVAVLLGGWYLHKPLNWPPSPFLKVLPISFHLTKKAGKGLLSLNSYGAGWLKKHGPIGCRDRGTVSWLKDYGIDAHLSGCFTLTLKPFENVHKHGKIVLIDLPDEVIKFIKRHTGKDTVVVSHKYTNPLLPPEVVEYAKKHDTKEVFTTSHKPAIPDQPYKESCYPGTWSYRRALVEGLLRFYQGASLVVSSRLHASLPSMALGTPVLLCRDEADLMNYRMATYLPYLNYTTPTDLLARKFNFNFDSPKPNPGDHHKFAERIEKACANFVNACENNPKDPPIDVDVWLDGHQKNMRLKRIMQMLLPDAQLPDPRFASPALYKY